MDLSQKDILSQEESVIRTLYQQLIASWNTRNAEDFASLFVENCDLIGFDGSQITGQAEVATTLRDIFSQHLTQPYVYIIRGVRFLVPDVALLKAIVGMIPPGQVDLDPHLNAIQSLVAIRHDTIWRIALFQNTPAALHGRPDQVQHMAEELRQHLT